MSSVQALDQLSDANLQKLLYWQRMQRQGKALLLQYLLFASGREAVR